MTCIAAWKARSSETVTNCHDSPMGLTVCQPVPGGSLQPVPVIIIEDYISVIKLCTDEVPLLMHRKLIIYMHRKLIPGH